MSTTNETAKHTPGPWKQNGPNIYAPDAHNHGSRFYDIAHSTNYMDDEGTANARLIAAAPDLLAACQNIIEHVEEQSASVMAGPWWRERRDEIRAAIAKATGGAA